LSIGFIGSTGLLVGGLLTGSPIGIVICNLPGTTGFSLAPTLISYVNIFYIIKL
jgi:hypothetical protein